MNHYVYGGGFNPVGVHHTGIVTGLRQKVIQPGETLRIIPCGGRPDKPSIKDIAPWHRAAIARLAFGEMPGVVLDLDDLENEVFTPTFTLDTRLRNQHPDDKIWHVIGSDLVDGGRMGHSQIESTWYRGRELWHEGHFIVIPRHGKPFDPRDAPPNSRIVEIDVPGSSTDIRERVYRHESITDLVDPLIEAYIHRYGSYTGRTTDGWAEFHPKGKPIVLADDSRPNTQVIKRRIERAYWDRRNEPKDHFLVIGGDGFMLRQIELYAHHQLPFIGLNAGTAGFLLNGGTPEEMEKRLERAVVRVYQQPLLHAEAFDHVGNQMLISAFNEFFVQSDSTQAVWMRVVIDGQERFQRLIGDGLMLSTTAGSTGWARSYGAQPYRIGIPMLLLTGVGTLASWPHTWAPLGINAQVTIECIDPDKRPMRLIADGSSLGTISRISIRTSRTQSVELGFFPETDLDEKVSRLHFPS